MSAVCEMVVHTLRTAKSFGLRRIGVASGGYDPSTRHDSRRQWRVVRRLKKKDGLPEDQVLKLDAVEFEWISTRKCGSSFMKMYREVLGKLTEAAAAGGDAAAAELLSSDADIKKWVDAQRQVHANGKLSESRVQYMADLPGVDWMNEV